MKNGSVGKSLIYSLFFLFLIAVALGAVYLNQFNVKRAFLNIRSQPAYASSPQIPLIGAIRWDAWFTGGPGASDEIALTPLEWHDRLPFYATIASDSGAVQIRVDTQDIMDQEISAAKAGGLNYWAFDYYGDSSPISNALNKYLASAYKGDIKFSLIILPQAIQASDWPASAINHFQDPQYVRVLAGRPLVYIFSSDSVTASNITTLRTAATAAGLPNPYIVWMTGYVGDGKVAALGLDAVSSYANNPTGPADSVQPYSNLATVNQYFWDNGKSYGLKVVPIVNTGWDPRPRYAYPPPWGAGAHTAVAVGSPSEIAANLSSALSWVASHPDVAESKAVIMYAWNEYAEGGWLAPLLQGGSARLDAINQTVQSADFIAPQVSIASPAPATTIAGTVTVTANASDNIGVAGVQFKLDGIVLGPEILTGPYSLNWDTQTVSNGPHIITAVARDTFGNLGNATDLPVNINNLLAPQPVGNWNFNEASGTVANDASGNGNIATFSGGASWSQGKNGSAINLNGVDGYATIADNTVLDGMKAMTLSAWVNLSQLPIQNYVIVGKDSNDASYRFTVGANGKVSFTVRTTNNSWYSAGTSVTSLTSLSPNSWDYVVGTYDGYYVRIYVNGKLEKAGAQVISGAVFNSLVPLRIGYKSSSNIDYTSGKVDEVTLYSVALNPSEIKALFDTMNQNADVTPPAIAITTPTNNAAVSGAVPINAVATDAGGIARVEFYVDGIVIATDSAAPYSISWNTTTYLNNSPHSLLAKAYDQANNSATSNGVSVTVVAPTPTSTPTLTPSPTNTPTPTKTPTPTPTPVTLTTTLNVLADTYVRKDATNNNYGSSSTLSVKGNLVRIAYLKFDLTSLAGRTIKSAKLKLRVSSSSSGYQNYKVVDTTSWSETTMTYNNRPATGTVMTTYKGGTSGTWITVDVISGVSLKKGQLFALAIDSVYTDVIEFYTKEISPTTYRPVLIVDYQ